MKNWVRVFWKDLRGIIVHAGSGLKRTLDTIHKSPAVYRWGMVSSILLLVATLIWSGRRFSEYGVCPKLPQPKAPVTLTPTTRTLPIRKLPKTFKPNTHKPASGEGQNSVSVKDVDFDPDRDLVHVDDDRVWWESEHDKGDTEDDHLMHHSMEAPLRQLIELVSARGGQLKVQDAYRPSGIHATTSLHRQGRAIDLTCDELGLEMLAKLCWVAGFDWVYYEAPRKGGQHVHCSVRP